MIQMKHCTTCGETNPDRFTPSFKTKCRRCFAAYSRARYAKRADVRERRRANGVAYRQRAEVKERERRNRQDPSFRARRARNLARYRLIHEAELRRTHREWTETHPDQLRAIQRRATRAQTIKGATAQRQATRRARANGASGSHTLADWLEKIALLGGCCIYCGRSDLPLTRDHKVPLVRGGSHDIANIVPACMPCNRRKGKRTAREYLALAG